MKKPNITNGEWKIKHEFHVVGERTVANCGGYFNNLDSEKIREQNHANAKAISAVPEMIEALSYIKRNAVFYNSAIEMDHGASGDKAEELINKALEKAGVEL